MLSTIQESLFKKGVCSVTFQSLTFTQEDCANNSFKQHKCLVVLTGKISNITVLDFDNDPITGTNCYEELVTAFPELRGCKTIKTWSGGYHIYCQYDPEIATGTNVFNEDLFPNYKDCERRVC
jgi:hypothetical protein